MKVSSRKYECVSGRTVTEIFDFKWDSEKETIEDFLIYVKHRFPNQEIRIVHGGAEVVITKKITPKEPKRDDRLKNYKSPGYPINDFEDDVYNKYEDYDDEYEDYEEENTSRKKRGKK